VQAVDRGLTNHDRYEVVKVREVIRDLERDGWRPVRQKGSHRQFHHPTKTGTVTIAGSLGMDLRLGTLVEIYRQAGLERKKQ
jgi:predicted RNA binding protein YcfA (HicA-like mRNA interferase family)